MDLRITQLELIEMLLETEQNDFSLTEKQYKIIDKRRENYLKGEGKSLTWEEVEQNASKAIS